MWIHEFFSPIYSVLQWMGENILNMIWTFAKKTLAWAFTNPGVGSLVGGTLVLVGLVFDSDTMKLVGGAMVMAALVGWILPDWMRVYIGECMSGEQSLWSDLKAWYHQTADAWWSQLWEFEQTLAGE